MITPDPPPISSLESISPTVHEAASHCLARASWVASGRFYAVPPHPRALLGIAVHAVLARAARAGFGSEDEEESVRKAESLFDEEMTQLFQDTHPLLRAKFGTQTRIPFYNLYRARAALVASHTARSPSPLPSSTPSQPQHLRHRRLAEQTLSSRDGKIRGRPDLIEVARALVVDYKTGSPSDSTTPTESEARQLRLYAHLAAENGISVRAGAVERANRTRAEISISNEDADEEGRRARSSLDEINRFSGRPFEDAATPSPQSCRQCPCIPFCPAFWDESDPAWSDDCGIHLEGVVESVDESLEGRLLVSMRLDVVRGTGARGPGVISRLSRGWLEVEQADVPGAGEVVRVVDVGRANPSSSHTGFRADRAGTAVWKV